MLSHEFCFLGKAGILDLHESEKHDIPLSMSFCLSRGIVIWPQFFGSFISILVLNEVCGQLIKIFCIELKLFLQTLSTNVKSCGSTPPSFSISAKLPNLRSPPWICPTSQRYHSQACIYVIFIVSLQELHMYSILVSYHSYECCAVFFIIWSVI